MSEIIISGGKRLEGAVHVHGAKNSVLPILAATILSGSVSVIHNCPRLSDVDATVAILEHLGCRVSREGQTVTVDSSTLDRCDIPDHLMREMRSSVIFLGAVLARTGEARLCAPGGCELGPRPIDLHLAALRRLGADIREKGGDLRCRTKGLRGTEISLTIPSVGATENAMLAACGAKGETVIYNAAREPEIVDLQQFLNACGARVRGAGSSAVSLCSGHRRRGDRSRGRAQKPAGAHHRPVFRCRLPHPSRGAANLAGERRQTAQCASGADGTLSRLSHRRSAPRHGRADQGQGDHGVCGDHV